MINADSLLLKVTDVAILVGVSSTTVRRLVQEGKFPQGIKLGGSRLWKAAELKDWIAAGSPDVKTWNAMADAAASRKSVRR
jgi:excisionase family DNA binding protein